jgi:hypothetical protein
VRVAPLWWGECWLLRALALRLTRSRVAMIVIVLCLTSTAGEEGFSDGCKPLVHTPVRRRQP